jgi:predicted ATPase
MRLDELQILRFKNLQNLKVNFDENSPYTVLVGENGSGKSNLIEALTAIFRNLDLDEPAPFGYEIKYRCRGRQVYITATEDGTPVFRCRSGDSEPYVELSKGEFLSVDEEDRPQYRPAFVFGYYSGPSDRLAGLFERHRERFYRWIIKPRAPAGGVQVRSNSLRRHFYAQTLHGQFALLAFFMKAVKGAEEDRAFLKEHLQIEGLDSVIFALKQPPWRQRGGDPRFWNAEGEVREFLSKLFETALVPLRMKRRIPIDLTKNPSVECLYLFLPDAKALEEVYKRYQNQYAFFTALESTHISKLLLEVRARVKVAAAAGGGAITYRDLSEGEQQLLLVLGLLKFTAEDETLFLLDEPDTHLNPSWSVRYLEFLDRFVENRSSCHIVMSTHDPLVFAGLKRDQVRIMRRDSQGRVVAEPPDQDPRGMGVAAILTSDLFRLRSTLDPETQRDLDRQRQLAKKDQPLDAAERAELEQLSLRLRNLGFSKVSRDPLYEQFLKAWTAQEDPAWSKAANLTEQQMRDRAELAAQIVREIKQTEQQGP